MAVGRCVHEEEIGSDALASPHIQGAPSASTTGLQMPSLEAVAYVMKITCAVPN